jgi:hypothetical protein
MYWRAVNEYLSDSGDARLRDRILERARADYPYNSLFAVVAAAPAVQPWETRGRSGSGATAGSSLHGVVIGLDAEKYSARGTVAQGALRRGLKEIFRRALAEAGIESGPLQDQDRGDGYLGVVSSSVPAERIVHDFVDRLRATLRLYNQEGRNDEGRIRLRLALHEGRVIPDETGWAGRPIVECSRLLDATPLRATLREDPDVDLVLIVSDSLYESVIKEGLAGIDPRAYRRVEVVNDEKDFQAVAWLAVPERGISRWN